MPNSELRMPNVESRRGARGGGGDCEQRMPDVEWLREEVAQRSSGLVVRWRTRSRRRAGICGLRIPSVERGGGTRVWRRMRAGCVDGFGVLRYYCTGLSGKELETI